MLLYIAYDLSRAYGGRFVDGCIACVSGTELVVVGVEPTSPRTPSTIRLDEDIIEFTVFNVAVAGAKLIDLSERQTS